jgi:hypothetical protein
MLDFILNGLEILGAFIAVVLGFGIASVAALLSGGFLTLLFAGAATERLVDDPY